MRGSRVPLRSDGAQVILFGGGRSTAMCHLEHARQPAGDQCTLDERRGTERLHPRSVEGRPGDDDQDNHQGTSDCAYDR